jgi:uncharacterized membrane-anchored protein YhcB (DUF1043 family)
MDWASTIRAAIALMVALLGVLSARHGRSLHKIHVLVNSNLDEIKRQLETMTAERDSLRDSPPEEPLQHLPKDPRHGYGSV